MVVDLAKDPGCEILFERSDQPNGERFSESFRLLAMSSWGQRLYIAARCGTTVPVVRGSAIAGLNPWIISRRIVLGSKRRRSVVPQCSSIHFTRRREAAKGKPWIQVVDACLNRFRLLAMSSWGQLLYIAGPSWHDSPLS
jgi:hypothetical protein